MMTTWNLVDNEKVRDNPFENRVCDCFLQIAIRYIQKTKIVLSELKSVIFLS